MTVASLTQSNTSCITAAPLLSILLITRSSFSATSIEPCVSKIVKIGFDWAFLFRSMSLSRALYLVIMLMWRSFFSVHNFDIFWIIWGAFLVFFSLDHFKPISDFYTPWKRQKTSGFLTFSGCREMKHWFEMA